MTDLYLWLKAAHIFFVIAWMASMLYLPRLMVYHAGVAAGSEASETFKVMERRLLRGIATPSMIITWILGLWLAYDAGFFVAGWLHGKILLVVLMSGVHGMLAANVRRFAADANRHTARYYRILNEVPAVLLIGILILVVVKPF